jgi:UrcA family protein
MFRKAHAVRPISTFAAIAAAVILAGGTALAQQNEAITVTPHNFVHKSVGRTFAGIPIDEVSVSRTVDFGDLNLSTAAGAAALKQRVVAAANQGCAQLARSDLKDTEVLLPSNNTCLAAALEAAIPRAEAAIMAARK